MIEPEIIPIEVPDGYEFDIILPTEQVAYFWKGGTPKCVKLPTCSVCGGYPKYSAEHIARCGLHNDCPSCKGTKVVDIEVVECECEYCKPSDKDSTFKYGKGVCKCKGNKYQFVVYREKV